MYELKRVDALGLSVPVDVQLDVCWEAAAESQWRVRRVSCDVGHLAAPKDGGPGPSLVPRRGQHQPATTYPVQGGAARGPCLRRPCSTASGRSGRRTGGRRPGALVALAHLGEDVDPGLGLHAVVGLDVQLPAQAGRPGTSESKEGSGECTVEPRLDREGRGAGRANLPRSHGSKVWRQRGLAGSALLLQLGQALFSWGPRCTAACPGWLEVDVVVTQECQLPWTSSFLE